MEDGTERKMSDQKFRHEFKYPCNITQMLILKERIKYVLRLDPNASNGQYCIRSLYFDSFENRCFLENENGVNPREKYRIRIYDGSDKRISLECKRKENGKTMKQACLLSKGQALALIAGEPICDDASPVLRKFLYLQKTQLFRPSVIVEYDRIPYVYHAGNVRITFDMNIRASTCFDSFFDEQLTTHLIPLSERNLLEVKFDELLPHPIQGIMELGDLRRSTFSKYYVCKKQCLRGAL